MSEDRKIRVLCVEDEKDILDNITEILRDEGYETFAAINGKAAFELFLQEHPDIIISDIMMPEVDGYALLKMVRESKNKNSNVPFIFLSALGQKENVLKGVGLLANDYLVKPIDFDILLAKVKEKTANANKTKRLHEFNISNLKNQISVILPKEIFAQLDSMTQMLQVLKGEPYGPLPHRRYVEDINKIYFDALKMRATVTNALDESVIENRLNVDEEILSLVEFIDQAIANLPEKLKNRVEFDRPYEAELLPQVKIDRAVLVEVMKKIIVGVIKSSDNSMIKISMMLDARGRMVMIFYVRLNASLEEIKENIEHEKLVKISDMQNCQLEVASRQGSAETNITFVIPTYRVVQ